jgi:hypothetical protein
MKLEAALGQANWLSGLEDRESARAVRKGDTISIQGQHYLLYSLERGRITFRCRALS